ncbi:MAG: bifunctional adenosylcobinamide kinase/adenosylcobinamide-phosphate guanylyltransferase [Candidatus Metalachnospira sp.]|nr:bifunctional adenosylcobinamide kinase/adenosylcobinamide-phosphate guanylyltransferase [Candidatus Metalachnospira sp.]
MKLYIGGFAQGKLNYATAKNNINKVDIVDAEYSDFNELINARCIYRLHEWIKNVLDESMVNELADRLISENPNAVIICDEVGYGVVPIDKNERVYRELVGRCLIKLANSSDEVERVVCGIGIKIK